MKKGWLLIEGEGKSKIATTTTTLTSNCNIENAKKHTWIFFSVNIDIRLPFYSFFIKISVDTGSKLNVHRTFRRGFGRLLKVLDFFLMFFGLKRPTCMLNLRPVSRGLAFGNVCFFFLFLLWIVDFPCQLNRKKIPFVFCLTNIQHSYYFFAVWVICLVQVTVKMLNLILID